MLAICLAAGLLVTISPLSTAAVYAPWLSVETYYLKLLNCTRTGGWVLSSGACSRYGSGYYSRYLAPLKWSEGLSAWVSRPYAKALAVNAACTHYLNGTTPASRMKAYGYVYPTWGENIGCRDGYSTPYQAVLASHRVFQSEKWANGGHWRNIKNSRFRYVGIGVWVSGSRTRLVTDFIGW
jgi:hypothetical protein